MKILIGFILLPVFCNSCSTETKSINVGSNNGKTITINGTSVYYEDYGQGTPLLLFSGGGINRSIKDFDKCIPELSKHYRVIAPDTPGQGRSGQSDSLSYDLLTDFMSQFIDSLKID